MSLGKRAWVSGFAGVFAIAFAGCGDDFAASTDTDGGSADGSSRADGGSADANQRSDGGSTTVGDAADAGVKVNTDATSAATSDAAARTETGTTSDAGLACGSGDKALLASGTQLTRSGLSIVSDNNTESGVSALDGGTVTLSDSTIVKLNDGLCGTSADAGTGAVGALEGGSQAALEAGSGTAPASGTDPGAGTTSGAGMPPGFDAGSGPGQDFEGGSPGSEAGSGSGPTSGTSTSTGVGATSSGVYAGSSSSVTLSNVQISTSLEEGKGLCATGTGASITMTKGTISTTGDSSHGVFATQGGSVKVTDVSITTTGQHCSTLATDQGGGTVIAEGGTFVAEGEYSAGIYSTGDIQATNAAFESHHDRVACMEGGSKITLTNCSLLAATKDAVIIYQSFSGDATVGTSEFSMTGGSITGQTADKPLIYITNTHASVYLKGVTLTSASGIVLRALEGAWMDNPPNGATPTQGGTVTFTTEAQSLPGNIELDENSSITAVLKAGSVLEGSVNADGAGKDMSLSLDGSSSWTVTATSHLTALTLADGAKVSAPTGKAVSMTVDGVATPIATGTFKGEVALTLE